MEIGVTQTKGPAKRSEEKASVGDEVSGEWKQELHRRARDTWQALNKCLLHCIDRLL